MSDIVDVTIVKALADMASTLDGYERALILESIKEIERLRSALQLSQSQNYCTLCGALEPKP